MSSLDSFAALNLKHGSSNVDPVGPSSEYSLNSNVCCGDDAAVEDALTVADATAEDEAEEDSDEHAEVADEAGEYRDGGDVAGDNEKEDGG